MDHAVGMIEMGSGVLVPYNLYNFTQEGGAGSSITGRGTSGELFSMGPAFSLFGDEVGWSNGQSYNENLLVNQNYGPIFSNQSHFDGSFCGEGFSMIFAGMDGEFLNTQHVFGEVGGAGFFHTCNFDCYDLSGRSFFMSSYPTYDASGTASFFVRAPITSPPSGLFVVGLSVNISTSTALAFINTAPVAPDIVEFGLDCSAWPTSGSDALANASPPIFPINWDATISGGVAHLRGMLTVAEMEYWMAYDWATHPGFA